MLRVLTAIALIAAGGEALAAQEASPSPAELEAASEASAAAVEAAKRPSADRFAPAPNRELDAAATVVRPGVGLPRLDGRDPAPDTVRALLKRARTGTFGRRASARRANEADLLVFVSFGIPAISLRLLLERARPIGAPLVVRGLVDDSMKETAKRFGELLGIDGQATGSDTRVGDVNLMIDPTLYERFSVQSVPTFVLALGSATACTPQGCPVPDHVKVAGDVSLAHALEVISREAGDERAREAARRWLGRLEARE